MSAKWSQPDLFAVSFNVQGLAVVEPKVVAAQPTHTITHTPTKGYKVVMAPGLTSSAQRNPCLSCDVFGRNMDACSENCQHAVARASYLENIGMGGVVCGVDTEASGAYGFGC